MQHLPLAHPKIKQPSRKRKPQETPEIQRVSRFAVDLNVETSVFVQGASSRWQDFIQSTPLAVVRKASGINNQTFHRRVHLRVVRSPG